MKEKDVKLLWSRAAGRCSFSGCGRRLTEDKLLASDAFPVGEQAHIVAEEAAGPRGASVLTIEERNAYTNMILLCPTHHTIIDKDPEAYPVEKLHAMKRSHELHMEQVTAHTVDQRSQAAVLVYTSLIAGATELCALNNWRGWTYGATFGGAAFIVGGHVDGIREFSYRVFTAIWPGTNSEFESCARNLATVLERGVAHFLEHAEWRDGHWTEDRFYRRNGNYNPNYDADLEQYKKWMSGWLRHVAEATKAANWFAEVVRRDFDPLYLLSEGRFTATFGDGELGANVYVCEYTADEKRRLSALAVD